MQGPHDLTWVIVQCVFFQFEFIDAAEAILTKEPLDGLDGIAFSLRGGEGRGEGRGWDGSTIFLEGY